MYSATERGPLVATWVLISSSCDVFRRRRRRRRRRRHQFVYVENIFDRNDSFEQVTSS